MVQGNKYTLKLLFHQTFKVDKDTFVIDRINFSIDFSQYLKFFLSLEYQNHHSPFLSHILGVSTLNSFAKYLTLYLTTQLFKNIFFSFEPFNISTFFHLTKSFAKIILVYLSLLKMFSRNSFVHFVTTKLLIFILKSTKERRISL